MNRSIHSGGDTALVLAVLRHDRVACGHKTVGPERTHNVGSARLVHRVDVAVQKMNHHGLATRVCQGSCGIGHLRFVQWREHGTFAVQAFINFQTYFAANQRREGAGQAIGLGAGASPKFEHIAKAARGNQAHLGDFAFQHRIGGGGRAVDDGTQAREIGLCGT